MKKFKKIYVEITNQCNLSCSFCPKSSRPPRSMRVEEFKEILGKIKIHTDYLYFHVMGEPLMHPDLGEFLDISYTSGFKVNITTNATLIEKTGAMLIQKLALRQINLSLHSCNVGELTGHTLSYVDKVLAFVKSTRDKKAPLISLRLWNLPGNKDIACNNVILKKIGSEFGCETLLLNKQALLDGVKIAHNVYLNLAIQFDWPGLLQPDRGSVGFCHGLRDQVAILSDGTVVPCCLDGQGIAFLGNIHQQSLSEILESTKAQAIYNGFSRRVVVEELCRKCEFRTRFS